MRRSLFARELRECLSASEVFRISQETALDFDVSDSLLFLKRLHELKGFHRTSNVFYDFEKKILEPTKKASDHDLFKILLRFCALRASSGIQLLLPEAEKRLEKTNFSDIQLLCDVVIEFSRVVNFPYKESKSFIEKVERVVLRGEEDLSFEKRCRLVYGRGKIDVEFTNPDFLIFIFKTDFRSIQEKEQRAVSFLHYTWAAARYFIRLNSDNQKIERKAKEFFQFAFRILLHHVDHYNARDCESLLLVTRKLEKLTNSRELDYELEKQKRVNEIYSPCPQSQPRKKLYKKKPGLRRIHLLDDLEFSVSKQRSAESKT